MSDSHAVQFPLVQEFINWCQAIMERYVLSAHTISMGYSYIEVKHQRTPIDFILTCSSTPKTV